MIHLLKDPASGKLNGRGILEIKNESQHDAILSLNGVDFMEAPIYIRKFE